MHAHVGRNHLVSPLRPRQLDLLRALAQRGTPGISHREAGALAGMHGTQVARMLDALNARGLVALSLTGLYLHTTPAGMAVVEA